MRVNLLHILYGCILTGMLLYMFKDVRDLWKMNPTGAKPARRFVRCALLTFFYLLPFIAALVVPYGYGLHAFIAGCLVSALPIYYIMRPLWAIRPSESMLRKRYGIRQRRRTPPPVAAENATSPATTESGTKQGGEEKNGEDRESV